MIMFDHKKAVSTIIKNRKHPDGNVSTVEMKPEEVRSEDGDIDGRHVAMQDFLSAIQEKSPAKMMDALAAFHDLHAAETEETPTEDSEESEEASE